MDSTYDTGACLPQGKIAASLSTPLLREPQQTLQQNSAGSPPPRWGKQKEKKKKPFYQHPYFLSLGASFPFLFLITFHLKLQQTKGRDGTTPCMPGKLMTRPNKTNHDRCVVSLLNFYPSFEKCNSSTNISMHAWVSWGSGCCYCSSF